MSLETDLQRLWNVCQVSIATEDVDGNDLKMTVMKQMSVVFGLLSHFMLARVLQCFEALLDQRSKQKQEKRFVYILYRFVRLRVVENDPNCLTYIMSYLKLVADPSLYERYDELAFNAGLLDHSIIIKTEDYKRVVHPELIDFLKDNPPS